MATIKTAAPVHWVHESAHSAKRSYNLLDRFGVFAETQEKNRTMWFFLALVVQGIFFLPLPVFLIYYYDASALMVLLITMTCFFTTIIAYMGGAGIKTVLLLSAMSILVQVLMSVVVVIF